MQRGHLHMLNKLKQRKQGFTIIEVLIVLAIAGLILLIVFLAVPALQRNSRNTQRKNDVASILGAVAEFSNNNNGKNPDTCSGTTPITFNTVAAGATTAEAKPGFYNLGCAAGAAAAVGHVGVLAAYAATGPYTTAAQDYLTLVPSARCNGNVTQAGSARQWAAIYMIETGTGAATSYAGACTDS